MVKRIKERAGMVKRDLTAFGMRAATGDAACLTKGDRIFIIAVMTCFLLLLAFSTCFAEGDIISQAGDTAKDYYGKIFGIVTFVAGLAAIICLIWIAISPTANGARVPLDWLKRILVAYACIMLLGGIFRLIQNLTAGQSTLP